MTSWQPQGIERPGYLALVAALQDPGIQKRFESQGMQAYPQTPEQFKQFIHSEIARWAPLIQSSGAGID